VGFRGNNSHLRDSATLARKNELVYAVLSIKEAINQLIVVSSFGA